ncbi:hypothetical protein NEUTE1DRAFT_50973 [Neurospora tetrasperma FGSC 2508]|uniref:MFS general substrate transporter n=1 Tax=Neurospora tetrasperma (strain FGSC 2508 / ATCC MYA-4615 / P0657) TaxID=510951 RepID=F8MZS5_NEUT8|nr:uncharacterized protein NEUTE1DRAFT_50973 [Neurospora tetrasperma FGSC 2508]EGO52062.1 hypothetical protein NEUTE1DRAFT_50973 [Neurospora tetrasperma FGSC 2508]
MMSSQDETSPSAQVQEETKPVALVTKTAPSSQTNENKTSDGPESDDPVPHLHAKTFLAVFAVCLIYIAQLISLVGAGAQGQTIASHFSSPTRSIWFSAPITILTVVLGPITSQAADYWGRKWFLVIPTFLGGGAGSLIVSRAPSMPVAILGFAVIGLGFGSQPLLHVVTSEVLPRRWRAWGQAADMASNTLGAAVGLYISVLYESDALLVGVRYSLIMIIAAIFACLTGWYCAVTKRVKWATFAAFGMFIAFFICMATTTRKTDIPTWGYTVLLGSALGTTLTTLVTVAQLSTPPELISVASGLIISIRSLGGTVGLAVYNALFHDVMKNLGNNVGKVVVPRGISPDDVEMFVTALEAQDQKMLGTISGVTADIVEAGAIALQETFVVAFRHVWIAGACFVALAAAVSLLLFDPEKEFNMHIDASVEKEEDLYSV